MKYYIGAAMADRLTFAVPIASHMRNRGHTCTFPWFDVEDVYSDKGRAELAELEINGVRQADAIIFVMPGGRGMHVELGAALVTRKPTLMLCRVEPKFSLFYHHPFITKVIRSSGEFASDIDEFMEGVCRLKTLV